MLNSGTKPPSARERVVHRVDRAARGVGGDRGEERGVEDAEADFLALHVAVGGSDAEVVDESDCRALSAHQQSSTPPTNNDRHRRPHRPAVLLVLHHSAQVISESAADGENGKHLDEIRQRRRIFERVRGVGVDVTAAVGAEHFDRDLRRHRPLHDVLFGDGLFFHHRLCRRRPLIVSPLSFFFSTWIFHRLDQRRPSCTA